ncbi:MAG TPA: radical SAM protein [Thermoanaerobaculia bacterium]|jgi:MoaA/NifB/PqqE/SkfB family radical SAM enzyme|nr:radical SAM protein [Thermoanaerobaculia bacterium]
MDANRWSNVLRLEQGYAAGLARVAARPLEAYVEVAARCNLRCEMCPIIVDPRYQPASGRPGLLAMEVFDRLEPVFSTLTRVYLFGLGEPVLHPDLVPMTERLTAAGVEVWITTNATLIDDELADSLSRAGLHRITVSIDGATPETYERIRKRGKFADVVRGLRALGAARRRHGKPLLYLSLVGMASNLAEIPDLVDLCAEVGGDGVFLEGLYPYPHPVIEEFFHREHLGHLGRERVVELVEAARLRAAFLGVDFITRMEELASFGPEGEAISPDMQAESQPPLVPADAEADAPAHGHPEELRLPWACSEPWMTINVNASGEVRPCCFNDDILGNLHEQTMEEIWNGPGFTGLRGEQAAGVVSSGCEVCVRNGRVKQSPWLIPREPVPVVSDGTPLVLETPADGELVSGPLVLIGRRANGRRGPLERDELPEVWLDHHRIAWASDYALIDGDAFAAIIPIDYVSAGSHRLMLRQAGGGESSAFAHRQIQTGSLDGGLATVSRLAVTVDLKTPEPRPVLRLDGRTHPLERWLCGPYGRGFLGVALLDVHALSPGGHDLDLFFTQHPRYHERVVRLG